MLDQYLSLLTKLLNSPETKVKNIGLLSDTEARSFLQTFNDNALPYDRECTITDMFAEQVMLLPDKTALIHNDRSLAPRCLKWVTWLKYNVDHVSFES